MEGRRKRGRLHQDRGACLVAATAETCSRERVDTRSGRSRPSPASRPMTARSGREEVYIPATAVYADGRTGREIVNGYCVEYHRAVYEVLGDGTVFARSGFTGTQAFPACWAGDNEPNFGAENGLPSVIVAGLSAAMSGYSIWGHDIGGYLDGTFSPVAGGPLHPLDPVRLLHTDHADAPAGEPEPSARQYPWGYAEAGDRRTRTGRWSTSRSTRGFTRGCFPTSTPTPSVGRDWPADHAAAGPDPSGRPANFSGPAHVLLRRGSPGRAGDRAARPSAGCTCPRATGSTSGRMSATSASRS